MLALRYLLITCGVGMMIAAVCILTYDLYREMLYRRLLATPGGAVGAAPVVVRWRTSLALGMLAWGPLLIAFSIVVVPSGMAGVRVSEMSGTVPGTLVSRGTHGDAAGGGCGAVRYAGSSFYYWGFGSSEALGERASREAATSGCAG